MTARHAHEEHAGRWVAYFTTEDDEHKRRTYLRRLRPDSGSSWTVSREDALRFDTYAEALRRVREIAGRHMGQRTAVEKITWGDWR